jgi:hypothetical protein
MSLPSILAVLDAVIHVSAANPRVRAWWLGPQARLPATPAGPRATAGVTRVDLAVESVDDDEVDCRELERELSGMLPRRAVVTVQMLGHGGSRGMLRLLHLDTHRAPRVAEKEPSLSTSEVLNQRGERFAAPLELPGGGLP